MRRKTDDRKVLTMLKDTLEKLSDKTEVSAEDKLFIDHALYKVLEKLDSDRKKKEN